MSKINERFRGMAGVHTLVEAMIKGLEKEWVIVSMGTYGYAKSDVCYGCAATNALCEIMQEPFTADNIDHNQRYEFFNYNITQSELDILETSYDNLRRGYAYNFLRALRLIRNLFPFKLPSRKEIEILCDEFMAENRLHQLDSQNFKESLNHYKKFAEFLKEKGY